MLRKQLFCVSRRLQHSSVLVYELAVLKLFAEPILQNISEWNMNLLMPSVFSPFCPALSRLPPAAMCLQTPFYVNL
jgi:hypothetical protein